MSQIQFLSLRCRRVKNSLSRRSSLLPLILLLCAFGFADLLSATSHGAPRSTEARAVNHSSHRRQDGCTVECSATVPESASVNREVSFAATSMIDGCIGAPTYEWDFGDNSGANAQSPKHTYTKAGIYNWKMTATAAAPSASAIISNVAGGSGDGNPSLQVSFVRIATIARDTQGRGLYLATVPHSQDSSGLNLIKFFNTSTETVRLSGVDIAPGTIKAIAGGGLETGENKPALSTDLNAVTGLAVNSSGSLVYYTEQSGRRVRAINVSDALVMVAGVAVDPGRIGTLAAPLTPEKQPLFGDTLYGLALNPLNGELAVADATPAVNRIYKIDASGTVSLAAGNGGGTRADDPFQGGLATNVPLLEPRAVKYDGGGNLIIADTGHARIVRVAPNGGTTQVRQFNTGRGPENSFPAGLAISGSDIYSANGNEHRIVRASSGELTVAGQFQQFCDYSGSNCGDGGLAINSGLLLPTTTGDIPIIGLEGDSRGIYVIDQSPNQTTRIRFINRSQIAATIAGVTINPGFIATIAGAGLEWPFDGGLNTSAALRLPVGVAVDAARNLFITDAINGRIRYANRGASTVTLFAGTPAQLTVAPGTIATINYRGGVGPNEIVPAHLASLQYPTGISLTEKGLFITDMRSGPFVPRGFNGRATSLLRYINTTASIVTFYPFASSPIVVPPGSIATIAGGGGEEVIGNGDGQFALRAKFLGMTDVAVAANGDIYLTEVGENAVRKINAQSGNASSLNLPSAAYTGLGLAPDGRLYAADAANNRLMRQETPGGNAFTALGANLGSPRDVAIDADGFAYVTSAETSRILRVSPDGSVMTVAGSAAGFGGDDGPATSAKLNIAIPPLNIGTSSNPAQVRQTVGITATPSHEIFFTDSLNQRVRRLGTPAVTCLKTGSITINNLVPTLTAITPDIVGAGSGELTLTVTGTNFVSDSVVRWKGGDRPTTYVSATQLTAQIPASDLTTPGTAEVKVFNHGPGGGQTAALIFTISSPVPSLTSLSPSTTSVGGPAFTLTVEGLNFFTNAVLRWKGEDRPTTVVSPTRLTAQIPAADIATAASVNVTVFNPPPGGGLSTPLVFSVNNPVPTLTEVSPSMISASGPPFTLTVKGTNFVNNSTIRWNNLNRTTTFVSATELRALIPESDIFSSGTANVTVFSPVPGGGTTAPLTVSITNPIPKLTVLTPSTAASGGNAFTLTLSGEGFIPGAEVFWKSAKRPTTLIDNVTLTAIIPATDLARGGTIPVTVVNPAPGGGTSNALDFTVTNPSPTLTRIDPDHLVAGAERTLQAIGTGFANGGEIRVGGQPRPTTFVNTTTLRAVLSDSDLANIGDVPITVFNPTPGGGLSGALNLTVLPNPSPSVSGISPNLVVAGRAALEIKVTGSNFVQTSEVNWKGAKRETTFVSDTELRARITAADLATAGTASVSVFNRPPGGGISNGVPFDIIGALGVVSAASFVPGPVAPGSIVAAFGAKLAVGTQIANTVPLPSLLLGTSVEVRDANGSTHQAPLFFVAPGQLNFLIPNGTAIGSATVTVTSGDGDISQGQVQVTNTAIGLFAANSNGKGVAAANFLRGRGTAQIFEDAARLDEGGTIFIPRCVNLGPLGEDLYLILYGTGIKGTPLSSLRATIGNQNVPVFFAGPQGAFAGLDQLNLGPIPRALLGAGLVDVVIRVNDQPVNVVKICIQ
jgi:uncharacterized protein (TIGR03437 family)